MNSIGFNVGAFLNALPLENNLQCVQIILVLLKNYHIRKPKQIHNNKKDIFLLIF